MKYLKDSWRRWLAWLVLACVFAVACVALSNWQLSRRQEKLAQISAINNNYNKPSRPIEVVLPRGSQYREALEWTPVSITGHYVVGSALLVRNRTLNGNPGFEQIAIFVGSNGLRYVVDRGWVPTGNAHEYPDSLPLPSGGNREIVARIVAGEPNLNHGAPTGQIASIYLPEAVRIWNSGSAAGGAFDSRFYLLLQSESPAASAPLQALPAPQADEGNHLSYAMQWIAFALMGFGALGWAIRQEVIFKRMAADPTYRPKQRKRVGDDDKAAEDSILDS
jgi:cytochrome oxidase assembly protein ShyY1